MIDMQFGWMHFVTVYISGYGSRGSGAARPMQLQAGPGLWMAVGCVVKEMKIKAGNLQTILVKITCVVLDRSSMPWAEGRHLGIDVSATAARRLQS